MDLKLCYVKQCFSAPANGSNPVVRSIEADARKR